MTLPVYPDVFSHVSTGMGPNLHWFPEDVPLSRLAATLVGMANSSGGTVLLGVSPRAGQILGIGDPSATVDRVFQACILADPPLVLPVPQVEQIDQARVLVVTVPAGLSNVYNLDGRYLGREGTQTNPLPPRRLRQLLQERGVLQFEALVPPESTWDDLDPDQVAAYLAALRLPGLESSEEILLRRGCLKRQGHRLCPTYAALLLFGRHPQQWLPNATLLAARFPGLSFSDEYVKQEISGSLPEQLHKAEVFIRENLSSAVQMTGLAHTERSIYPFEAVRELLVNAVAHRDYNLQGDTIHLNIFSDRIEVHSPGGLPGPVTLENLLEARFSRNAVIVQVLSDLGFVERLGYGLDRVVALARQHGLRPPRFEEVAGSFRATLLGPTAGLPAHSRLAEIAVEGVNPRQQTAIAYLGVHPRITNSEYQSLCPDVHSETLRRDLADLVTRGLLIKVGDKRATYYILK